MKPAKAIAVIFSALLIGAGCKSSHLDYVFTKIKKNGAIERTMITIVNIPEQTDSMALGLITPIKKDSVEKPGLLVKRQTVTSPESDLQQEGSGESAYASKPTTLFEKEVHRKVVDLPFLVDSSWRVKTTTDTSRAFDSLWINNQLPFNQDFTDSVSPGSRQISMYTKQFADVNELKKIYVRDTSYQYGLLNRDIDVSRKFRWFYTVWEYKELYYPIFQGISFFKTFTSDEIKVLKYNESARNFLKMDSLTFQKFKKHTNDKYVKWYSLVIYENYLSAVLLEIENTRYSKYKPSIESIRGFLVGKDVNELKNSPDFYDIVRSQVDSGFASWLKAPERRRLRELDVKMIMPFKDYRNFVSLPGTIKQTNGEKLNSGLLSWNVSQLDYLTDKLEMQGRSEVVNLWAYWVTAIIILIGIGLIAFPKILRKA